MHSIVVFFGMLDIFVKLNRTKAAINEHAATSNNIEYYVDTLYLCACGLLRAMFIYQLFHNQNDFYKLLSKLQARNMVRLTHSNRTECATRAVCVLTILISMIIAITGLDTVHFYIVKTSGWSFRDVMLQHEYNIVNAFTKLRLWNENATDHILNSPLSNSSVWTPLEVLMGGIGISSSFCGLLLESAIRSLFLTTTVMLYITTRGMQLDEAAKVGNLNLAQTQTLFHKIVKRFETLMDVTKALNQIIGKLIPFLVSVDALAIIGMLNHVVDANWSSVSVHVFKLTQDIIAVYVTKAITSEVKLYAGYL